MTSALVIGDDIEDAHAAAALSANRDDDGDDLCEKGGSSETARLAAFGLAIRA